LAHACGRWLAGKAGRVPLSSGGSAHGTLCTYITRHAPQLPQQRLAVMPSQRQRQLLLPSAHMACQQRRRRRGPLLLLAAVCAASLGAASAQCPFAACGGAASLPRNFSALPPFPTRPGFHDEPPGAPACAVDGNGTTSCERAPRLQFFNSAFWDRARLARAAIATHTPDAWRPLLAKLRAGQPITVLGFGSSVVEGHSGCYAVDVASLHAAGVARAPPNMARVLNATGACRMPGYMSAFLHGVNVTWPHAGHLYVNAGVSAASLGGFASHMCVDAFLPSAVDLLLFEQHGESSDAATTIRRGAARRAWKKGLPGHVSGRAPAAALGHAACASCHCAPRPLAVQLPPSRAAALRWRSSARRASHAAATYVAQKPLSFSLSLPLANTNKRDVEALYFNTLSKLPPGAAGAPPPLVLLSAFTLVDAPDTPGAQRITPCVGRFGDACSAAACSPDAAARLVARVTATAGSSIEDALAAAARRYGWATLSLRDALAAGIRDGAPGALNWTECEWINAFLKDWVHPSLPGRRLLGDALLTLLLSAQDAADGDGCDAPPPPPVALPAAPLVRGARAPSLRACEEPEQLGVTRADGWALVKTELVSGRLVHKPGWIATAPGAELVFNLSTRFAAAPAEARVALTLRFLTSYEHMGVAELRCVGGCACEPATLQAHAAEHVSVEHSGGVQVTQAAQCALSLRVLDASDSPGAEHKFKLVGAAVGFNLTTTSSAELPAAAAAANDGAVPAPGADGDAAAPHIALLRPQP
jgi:hypothetical protein